MRKLFALFLLVPTTFFSAPQNGQSSQTSSNSSTSSAEYRIGSDDVIIVEVFDIGPLNTTARVSASGSVSLKLIGAVSVAGLTPHQIEKKVEDALKEGKYVNAPHVTVTVQEYASQPVQILGAIKSPSIYQIKGQKNLFGMIAIAGGFSENVGQTIQIRRGGLTRGTSELPPDSLDNPKSGQDVITIGVEDFQNGTAGINIPIFANDAIYVSNAESVFTAGELTHPEEFILRNGKNITVLQALGKAGGFTRDARKKEAVIIRYHSDQTREDIPVDIDKIVKGTAPDTEMMPNDIFYVPSNRVKTVINRGLETAISVVTGRLIYR